MTPRNLTKLPLVCAALAVLLGLVSTASGESPPVQVTVFDPSEKVVFRGPLAVDATFATRTVPPGRYVVQFNSKSAAVKGHYYFLAISAGNRKVIADAVAGELLTHGGAAMRVDVGPGLKITGQIVKEVASSANRISNYRMIDGRRYAWLATHTGSHLGGRWVDASLPSVSNLNVVRMEDFRKAQDHAGEGSMLGRGTFFPASGRSY
jgi:hypothetical protein